MRSPQPQASSPQAPVSSLYACLYRPVEERFVEHSAISSSLVQIAEEFSPRYEWHRDDLVSIDIRGLDRLVGSPRTIGEEMRRDAASRGIHAHVAVAATRMTALVMALARPGLTVVGAGEEAATLASIPLSILEKIDHDSKDAVSAVTHWGIRTLGELAALPPADLAARIGQQGVRWQALARGEDARPLVPTCPEERFESSMDLEWPIEGLEPLSFVLTRLLEPLSTRLERCDRGAVALHVVLHLVTKTEYARRLELPTPMRDVRTLRTLALLDLESHPPAASIDGVTVTIDPTPGRVVQHTLFVRPHPTPEQLSTLLARLGALMGQDRIGMAMPLDSYRPGAFEMKPFAIEHHTPRHDGQGADNRRGAPGDRHTMAVKDSANARASAINVISALRRYRQPIAARVTVGADRRPLRVSTDRIGSGGGAVTSSAGPWRTSGAWWESRAGTAGEADKAGRAGTVARAGGWDRDEWDVALGDGTVYRIFCDRSTAAWFIDAIVD